MHCAVILSQNLINNLFSYFSMAHMKNIAKCLYATALTVSLALSPKCHNDSLPSQQTIDWFVAKRGYSGEDIGNMKRFLNCYNNYNDTLFIHVDSIYDWKTAAIVMQFQKDEKLHDRDGLAGKKTIEAMIDACEEKECTYSCTSLKSIKK
jgi:hypothetical protein